METCGVLLRRSQAAAGAGASVHPHTDQNEPAEFLLVAADVEVHAVRPTAGKRSASPEGPSQSVPASCLERQDNLA
jgi:hypothetical protein